MGLRHPFSAWKIKDPPASRADMTEVSRHPRGCRTPSPPVNKCSTSCLSGKLSLFPTIWLGENPRLSQQSNPRQAFSPKTKSKVKEQPGHDTPEDAGELEFRRLVLRRAHRRLDHSASPPLKLWQVDPWLPTSMAQNGQLPDQSGQLRVCTRNKCSKRKESHEQTESWLRIWLASMHRPVHSKSLSGMRVLDRSTASLAAKSTKKPCFWQFSSDSTSQSWPTWQRGCFTWLHPVIRKVDVHEMPNKPKTGCP